jgi:hypothetical protein
MENVKITGTRLIVSNLQIEKLRHREIRKKLKS